jgi:(1->4)-alpha-D-glucan 1-alpha-D-glucosylmutase
MGLVLDIVPNHQGIGGPENPWWWDVLKHGRQSPYAHHFDIDWDLPDPGRRGKVLLPVLEHDLAQALERRELAIVREEGELLLRYFDHRFPLNPASLAESGLSLASAPMAIRDDTPVLERLLSRQHYELIDWRDGDRRLNYRRFFTIADLAGLRVELPRVFDDTHQRILDWHRRGLLDGLRIDHPDGLRDPESYLERLSQSAPGAWIVVEKILMTGEQLPPRWPVAGTTGYDFLGRVNALLVDPEGESAVDRVLRRVHRRAGAIRALVREKKRWILRERLATEVSRLARLASRLAARDGRGQVLHRGAIAGSDD